MRKYSKKGISLVVLVITMIVLLILSSVTILNISNESLKIKTKKVAFKNNVTSYLEEIENWNSMQRMKFRGNFDESKVNASTTVAYNGEYIQDIIKNIKEEDIKKFEIIGGKLVYTGNGVTDSEELANETIWAKEFGIYNVAKALGEVDTIVFTDTEIESVYDNIRIFGDSSNGINGLNEITLTVTQNLIDNGFGEYKDNRDFSGKVINISAQKVKGGISSFSVSSSGYIPQDMVSSYIEVEPDKKYEISMYLKPDVMGTLMYSGVVEYDKDKDIIRAPNVYYIPNTLTYLTQDLKNGDTVVYINDVSNFKSVENTPNYQLGFIFWNYKDSTGNLYSAETYSRNVWANLYTYDKIDKRSNTITLNSEWSNGTIKAGTMLSQSNDGATYNYCLLPGRNSDFMTWEYFHASIQGINNNTLYYSRFRYGTKYIKWYIMSNYNYMSDASVSVANIIFAESDKYNKQYTIDMTGHEPLRAMEDGTADYIDYKNKRIVRCVGVSGTTLYKLSSETYESITLPTLPIYEGNTAITLNQTGRLEGTYIK